MPSPSATSARAELPAESVDQRFPKSRRLLRRSQFRAVYDAGSRLPGPYFLIFWRDRQDAEPSLVGLTASRKVGKAVVRNRGKRLIREAARRHWDAFPAGCDIIFHLRRDIRGAVFEHVEGELLRLLGKLSRRREELPAAPPPATVKKQ
ncbi:MAG: ribonuclease P protein component [Acidobacteria bacterium]|nr:ribonuclease P protein component [Acidobacteriota bacterium]